MARPRINEKKICITLTIEPKIKEYFDKIREYRNVSISEFLEEQIKKELEKIRKEELKNKKKDKQFFINELAKLYGHKPTDAEYKEIIKMFENLIKK